MFNILIPNATGPNNMGDQAILAGMLLGVKSAFPGANIVIHSYDPDSYIEKFGAKIDHSLYTWTVFRNLEPFERAWRLAKLVVLLFSSRFNFFSPEREKIQQLINDYKKADLIIFSGGGYFRTKSGFTQSLNLIMQLVMFWCAILLNKSSVSIVGPVSFGPFNYKWQEKLVVRTIRNLNRVFVRESISFDQLNRNHVNNTTLLNDAAFFLPYLSKQVSKVQPKVIGFTIRDWGVPLQSENVKASYVQALSQISKKYGLKVQPILQVDGPKYGESDSNITQSVSNELLERGVPIEPIVKIKSISQALDVYSSIDLFLGMRMHSNILAATQHVPFVAVGYEHKTIGIMELLGLKPYCVEVEIVDTENLYGLLDELYQHGSELKSFLINSVEEIRQNDLITFISVLKKHENKQH